MSTFDYSDWVQRAATCNNNLKKTKSQATEFGQENSIAPPLSKAGLKRLQKKLDCRIPIALEGFLAKGSSHCDCRYYWEAKGKALREIEKLFDGDNTVFGGAQFCSAAELPEELELHREFAHLYDQPVNVLPFCHIQNGDTLALDLSDSSDNPPVFYMCLSGDSDIIVESFTDFLETWEQLFYIGPEFSLLDKFKDRKGFLTAKSKKAQQLKAIFEC